MSNNGKWTAANICHLAGKVVVVTGANSGIGWEASMAIPYRKTEDGFEMQFGTNHLGHFALTGTTTF